LDYYGNSSQPKEAAISGALYKRPYEKDQQEEELWLSQMKAAVADALGINPGRIFLKLRQRQRGDSQYEKTAEQRFTKIVREGSLSYKVNLSDYLDTGLFPDRRLLRALIRSMAEGKRILNLFSYTGSFSISAAAGGAASTDSVDISNTYLAWSEENFSLNNFKSEIIQSRDFFPNPRGFGIHKLIRADALVFIPQAASFGIKWDLIILDPPAFSNSKKMTGNLDLQRDHADLAAGCIGLLSPGGKIILSVNTRRFRTTAPALEQKLSSHANNIHVTRLEEKIIDEDFKGRKMPLSFVIANL
jgi:23S rRNA G2069 N7-methylase RlmK/C1962 C5-methylase RlmI